MNNERHFMRVNIEYDLDGEESNREHYGRCAQVAAEALFQSSGWPEDFTLVFTNKVERACQGAEPKEILFFISDSKDKQKLVSDPFSSAVVVYDGLDHLPRVVTTAVRARLKAIHLSRLHLAAGD